MELEPKVREKVVDAAEPGIIREKLLETGWVQKRLPSGDYKFHTFDFKRVGITRKKVEDLLKSIGETFSKQLEEMLDFYDINILLLEGSWKWVFGSDKIITTRGIQYYSRDLVWDYLHRWFAKGFIPELTVNEGDTIHRLNRLFVLYQKSYSMSARSRKWTDDRVLAFPSGARGKTALDCLKHFGSLADICLVSPEQLRQVDGVGGKKAELIFNHFHKETT